MDSMPVSGGGGGGGPQWPTPPQSDPYGGYQPSPQQQQPQQAQPGRQMPQMYRDVYGQLEFATPGLAGQRAQFGGQHTIGQYDQQGVWNPLAEQNSANGVAGRSWGAGAGGVHPGFGGGQQQAAWQAAPMMSAQDAYTQAQQSGDQRGALMAQAQMNGARGNTSAAQMAAQQAGNWNAARGTATVAPGSTRTVPRRIG